MDDDVCKTILDALAGGRFRLSVHAAERMSARSVSKADIQACGRTASACIRQSESGTFRVHGSDLDGDPLTVICALSGEILVVTFF